jgi:hypothetical protein
MIRSEIDTIMEIARVNFFDAIAINSTIEILELGNQEDIIAALVQAGAGRAARRIRNALFTQLHILTARAYSVSRDGDRHLRRAAEVMKSEAVRSHFSISNESDVHEFMTRWNRCIGDHRLERFLHFRDKHLAHLSSSNPDIPAPRYKEVFDIARATAGAMEKLAHATGIVSLSLESQLGAERESAVAFWSICSSRRENFESTASDEFAPGG